MNQKILNGELCELSEFFIVNSIYNFSSFLAIHKYP